MDVAVLVDLSQRASAPDVTQVRTSLGDLVDNLHVQSGGRHMAVMTYGSQVRLTSALSGNAGQLKTDIARLTPAGGAADMALALQSMRDLLTSQGRPSVSKVSVCLFVRVLYVHVCVFVRVCVCVRACVCVRVCLRALHNVFDKPVPY